MPEARLSIRVDEDVKKRAESVFRELGMPMSTGINLYLKQVIAQQGIPFPLKQVPQVKRKEMEFHMQMEELKAQMTVESKIKETLDRGVPVALYDDKRNCPYMQYPDGRRVYDIDE